MCWLCMRDLKDCNLIPSGTEEPGTNLQAKENEAGGNIYHLKIARFSAPSLIPAIKALLNNAILPLNTITVILSYYILPMNTGGSHYKKNVNVKIAVLHIECSAF